MKTNPLIDIAECRRQSRLVNEADAADPGLSEFLESALAGIEGWTGQNEKPKRILGAMKGAFEVPEDFDDPLPGDLLDAFEGKK